MTAVREVETVTAVDCIRARRDAGIRLAALVMVWGACLLVGYWWVTGRGLQDLGGWSTGLSSAGRLTGLLAAVLLLVQVLLMARIPVLEGAFGQDRLARLHRLSGFTSFNLMLAHVCLITWGYAAGDLWATPRTFWDLTLDYPGMLLAVAGTLCLILVVITSIKAARRKLRYESWHLLHLYAYLGPVWRCRTSCGPGRTSSDRGAAPCSGGDSGSPRWPRYWCSGSPCRWSGWPGTGSGSPT